MKKVTVKENTADNLIFFPIEETGKRKFALYANKRGTNVERKIKVVEQKESSSFHKKWIQNTHQGDKGKNVSNTFVFVFETINDKRQGEFVYSYSSIETKGISFTLFFLKRARKLELFLAVDGLLFFVIRPHAFHKKAWKGRKVVVNVSQRIIHVHPILDGELNHSLTADN